MSTSAGTHFLVVIAFLASACSAFGQSKSEDGFVSIFDGQSLDGWHLQKTPPDDRYVATFDNFFVKDGALHCFQLKNRNGGLLLTDKQYGDFEIQMEIKIDWGCDSGIFLRCTEAGEGIQILNDYLENGSIGFPFGQGTGAYISRPFVLNEADGKIKATDVYDAVATDGLVYALDAAGWNKTWKPGEWNSIKIRCVGKKPWITTWVNGVKTMKMDGSTYKGRSLKDEKKQNWDAPSAWDSEKVQQITGNRGSIALQIHPGARWEPGGSAMYRNIRIKELTTSQHSDTFAYTVTDTTRNRKLSAAMQRSFNNYSTPRPQDNELYSQFKYTRLKGFDYHDGDGTISRRDPTKVIFENGKYYVWYTYRNTPSVPKGPTGFTDTIPSTDWDLSEIWCATSEDGFTWKEQGVAVPRPLKPTAGWRSVSTPDILKFKGKFYLYYQAFQEASGTRGDYCPVAVSWADSPDGPWTPANKVIVETGGEGAWDQFAIHDPNPLVHNGKVYLYYKSAFNRPDGVWVANGLAIAEDPLGPFKKHPLNPIVNSGHETVFFPFKEGVACFVTYDGQEHFTIQYAKDWVNFEIASITEMMPTAAGPFVQDAFTDSGDGRGITWGISHFTNAASDWKRSHSQLTRFDCDLSLDVDDPDMKKTHVRHSPEHHYKFGLKKQQRERIEEENHRLKN